MAPIPPRPGPPATTTRPALEAVKPAGEPRVFRPLPEGASDEQHRLALNEMASAYATAAHALAYEVPLLRQALADDATERAADRLERRRIDGRIDEMGLGLARVETRLEEHIEHITGRVTDLEMRAANDVSDAQVAAGGKSPPLSALPPMRAELPSGLNLEQAAFDSKEELLSTLQHLKSISPGPADVVSETPERLMESLGPVVDGRFAMLERERERKAELARLQAVEQAHVAAIAEEAARKKKKEDDDERDADDVRLRKRAWKYTVSGSIFVLLVASIVAFFWGRATAPPTPVPVPVAVPAGSAGYLAPPAHP